MDSNNEGSLDCHLTRASEFAKCKIHLSMDSQGASLLLRATVESQGQSVLMFPQSALTRVGGGRQTKIRRAPRCPARRLVSPAILAFVEGLPRRKGGSQ